MLILLVVFYVDIVTSVLVQLYVDVSLFLLDELIGGLISVCELDHVGALLISVINPSPYFLITSRLDTPLELFMELYLYLFTSFLPDLRYLFMLIL